MKRSSKDTGCLKTFLLFLFLAAPLASVSSQALDEADTPDPYQLATTEQAREGVSKRTENVTDESPEDVDSGSFEESGPESKIVEKPPLEWKFYWYEGFHYWLQRNPVLQEEFHIPERLRAKPKLEGKVGALLQVDAALFGGDDSFEDFSDGVQVRRFRLYTNGSFFLWVPVYYKFQFGISKGTFYLNDGYLQLRDLPLIQTVTFGYLKAPFSMERLAGSGNTTFMERASAVDAFTPGFKAGLKGSGTQFQDRMTWSVGGFTDGQEPDSGDVSDSNFRIVGRLTGLPLYVKDLHNNRLMHLGLSFSYVNAGGDSVQYRSRPECHIAPYVVDTGEIPANNADLLGAEIAYVMNSLSLQGEYIHSWVNSEEGGILQFKGSYVYVSYFLTGETRLYDKNHGIFTRVRPRKNFSLRNHTYGGLEIEGRYSRLDLDDGDVQGGRMHIFTAGATWYLFPVFKLKFNYQNAKIANQEGDDRVHIFQTRFEVDL
jgi:phosphate-selective porin OprO/OprP